MVATYYYPSSKNTHNFKDREFLIKKIQSILLLPKIFEKNQVCLHLDLSLTPLQMAYHTFTKPIGLIYDLKIHIHGIPYVVTFTIMCNCVLDSNYSMLLENPWLHNAKVTHDQDNNLITIEGNGMVQTIAITKHLDGNISNLRYFYVMTS